MRFLQLSLFTSEFFYPYPYPYPAVLLALSYFLFLVLSYFPFLIYLWLSLYLFCLCFLSCCHFCFHFCFHLSCFCFHSFFLKNGSPHEEKFSVPGSLLPPLLCLINMYVATVLVTKAMMGSFLSFSDGVR
jgi:hypothetical protein